MPCYFESHTTYDEAAYRALIAVMTRKVRPAPRIAMMSVGVLLLIGGTSWLLLSDTLVGGVLLLLAGCVIFLFSVFLEFFAAKMLMKEQKADQSVIYLYRFLDTEFTVTNAVDTSTVSYESIQKILPFRNYLFLFGNDQVHLVEVGHLSNGKGEELCKFLESRIHPQNHG